MNRICGRPYRPRDLSIRRVCQLAGCTWPEPKHKSRSSLEDGSDDYEDEGSESEFETGDEDSEASEPERAVFCKTGSNRVFFL